MKCSPPGNQLSCTVSVGGGSQHPPASTAGRSQRKQAKNVSTADLPASLPSAARAPARTRPPPARPAQGRSAGLALPGSRSLLHAALGRMFCSDRELTSLSAVWWALATSRPVNTGGHPLRPARASLFLPMGKRRPGEHKRSAFAHWYKRCLCPAPHLPDVGSLGG